MKKIEYAWIEQIISFADWIEKRDWLAKRNDKLGQRHCSMKIIKEWTQNDRLFVRIRLPYNNSEMLEGEYVFF